MTHFYELTLNPKPTMSFPVIRKHTLVNGQDIPCLLLGRKGKNQKMDIIPISGNVPHPPKGQQAYLYSGELEHTNKDDDAKRIQAKKVSNLSKGTYLPSICKDDYYMVVKTPVEDGVYYYLKERDGSDFKDTALGIGYIATEHGQGVEALIDSLREFVMVRSDQDSVKRWDISINHNGVFVEEA